MRKNTTQLDFLSQPEKNVLKIMVEKLISFYLFSSKTVN